MAARVLIIDDDAEIRESLRDVLEAESYDVMTAENGRDGLERLSQVKPSLVLLDLMMPIMSGGELLAVLRERDELTALPIVVLSAWPVEAEQVKAWTQGYLKKPVSLDALLSVVEKFCGPPAPASNEEPAR